MIARTLLAAAAVLALSACGSSADDQPAPGQSEEPVAAASDMPSLAPQAFVDAMAGSDTFEIEAGTLAGEMGRSKKVKDFGAMMVKDHTDSSAKLKTAAAAAQPALTVKPELTAEQEANLAALRAAGDEFDALYAQQQVVAHEKALATLRDQSENGTSAPLKAFAGATAGVVEHHLGMAKSLP